MNRVLLSLLFLTSFDVQAAVALGAPNLLALGRYAAAPLSQSTYPPIGGGHFYVVLGQFPVVYRVEANAFAAAWVRYRVPARAVEAHDYYGFEGGYIAVVLGPYEEYVATVVRDQVSLDDPSANIMIARLKAHR